jgi:hypothetical protein
MPIAAHHKKHLVRGLVALLMVVAFAGAGIYWQFVREVVPVQNCGAIPSTGGAAGACP